MLSVRLGFSNVAGKVELSSVRKAKRISLSSERIALETSNRPIFSTEDKSSKTKESDSKISGSIGSNFALSLKPTPTVKFAKLPFPEATSSMNCSDKFSAHS